MSSRSEGTEGRIDFFDSEGFYIGELKDLKGPRNITVDTDGNLYVFEFNSEVNEIARYKPTPPYNPEGGEITYKGPAETVISGGLPILTGIAINRTNDHLFVHKASAIAEYGSAEEGNTLIDGTIGQGNLSNPIGNAPGLAVDATHKRIYATSSQVVKVFDLQTHELLDTIKGSETPLGGEFAGFMSLAADEDTGNFFVFDGSGSNAVYEFNLAGEYQATIEHKIQSTFGGEITVDNGESSPNKGYLYVPSHPSGTGHSFAFGPEQVKEAPEVEPISFSGITEAEAQLEATIDLGNLETAYTIEYTAKEAFEAEGFEGADLAGEGSIPAGPAPVEVSASAEGLAAGTTYVFRVVAENEEGSDEAQSEFATYPAPELPPCSNEAVRNVFSRLLPDCRSYELVTPSDTNGRTPLAVGFLGAGYFATLEASPDGNAASFEIEGGAIPGFDATGSYAGDPYLARRTEAGWSTEYAGPTGEEAPALLPGSNSPDQGYLFWSTAGGEAAAGGEGTAQIEGKPTTYVRYPDGHSELIGRGSLGTDPRAQGLLIGDEGTHILFASGPSGPPVQLEENAPKGSSTIYDRTIGPKGDEETHVVSLLPGDKTPGESAVFAGASLDGRVVAFAIGKILYLRYNDEETYEIGEDLTFAGFGDEGKRIFYLEGGNLYAYEVEGEANPIAFSSSGDVTPINVAAGGSVAYIVSPSVLPAEPNPRGDLPEAGKENLYRSEEGAVSFLATVTKRDVEGESNSSTVVDGLGLWTVAAGPGQFGKDPSRSTPDGQVLLFSSRANLGDYDAQGHPELYRYVAGEEASLACLSCNPTLAPAEGDASLQSVGKEQGSPEPGSSFVLINNLRADGSRAIFQSTEPLVLEDTDGLQDVYEWEAQGVGTCTRAGGCVYLISSGHSHRTEYLWGLGESGDDVFFRSSNLLLGVDTDETPSIYDARVDGGFPESSKGEECQGEGCRLDLTSPTGLPTPGMLPDSESGNVPFSCPKGKHKAIRNGKTVCVKNKKKHHKKHKKHRKAGKNGGTGK